MGTEVHSKMHLPGYYSLRNLNDNAGNGSWSLHHENKSFGQYYDLFLARPTMDLGCEKEQLRQTILKQETIFRHQLYELHRLYRIQRDMMNEIRSKELHPHLARAEASESCLFPSGFLYEDDRNGWHNSKFPSVDLNCGRLSRSGADSIQSKFSTMKGNILQSGCCSSDIRLGSKDYDALESKSKKLRRKLFDLELPANEYLNDEDEGHGVSGGLAVRDHHFKKSSEVTYERAGILSFGGRVNSECNGDAFGSDFYGGKSNGITNLNEPAKVEEASTSASIDIRGNITCSKGGMQSLGLSSGLPSSFQCLAKEFSHETCNRRNGGVSLSNLHPETKKRQEGWSSYNFEAGQTRSNGTSFFGSFNPLDLHASYKLLQVECGKAHQSKREQPVKRKIFGVEISETDHEASTVASHMNGQCPSVPQSSVVNSESSTISSMKRFPSSLGQNVMLSQGNASSGAFSQSNNSLVTLKQSSEVIQDKLLVNSDSRSVQSLGAEVSCQNGLSCPQLESKESQVWHSSINCSYSNGMSNINSACNPFNQHGLTSTFRTLGCMSEVFTPPDVVSVNGSRKQESPPIILSWLRTVPHSDGKSSREKEGLSQLNLQSSQKYSKQSVDATEKRKEGPFQSFIRTDDAEHGRTEVGDCSTNKNSIGLPILEKHPLSKDLTSQIPALKPASPAAAFDGPDSVKVELLNSESNHDPVSPRTGEQCKLKGLVLEKGLFTQNADSRHFIDLNLCFEGVQEEAQPVLRSSGTNIKIGEIDLEVPLVAETALVVSSGHDLIDNKLKKPSNSLQDDFRETDVRIISLAAEALISISLSSVHNLQGNASCSEMEASQNDPLHWFAEVIFSHKGDIDGEIGSALVGKDSPCCEDLMPDGIDYFEFMTLNLAETEVTEYNYKAQDFETPKDGNTYRRRPRRGQAKRGRQRKDFQRDILPSLASLSRNEVTDDLQAIEGLVRAAGGTWQSSLLQRNAAKTGPGRGRRRVAASASPSPAVVVFPPPVQPPSCKELVLEETNLTGWGKRTRRPPRQRCLINNPPIPLK